MSYIVLARKWRPQTFNDLIGQETLVRTIQNALSGNKIVHAYLFSGPRGVGKTSAARILAKALNCSSESDPHPCGSCQNCIAIAEGSSVDVLEIDGASNTGVDDVRELREAVKYAPSSSLYKIYIIDEVHMLSIPAFNALLKTLEEPPPHVIFIFATTEPRKVPVTILSRCQHHSFRKIPGKSIKGLLTKICRAENIKIQDTALEMISRAADGSIRDALTVLDQAASFSSDIDEQDLQDLLGIPDSEIIKNLSVCILSGDISSTLSAVKDLSEKGHDLRSITRALVEHFRNISIMKVVEKPDEFLELSEEETKSLKQQASMMNTEELTLLLTEFLKLEQEVRKAPNPRYALELGLLRTSFIKGMTSISDILKRIEETPDQGPSGKGQLPPSPPVRERSTSSPEQHEGAAQPERPAQKTESEQAVQGSGCRDLWNTLLQDLKDSDPLLFCKLSEAKLISISGSELTIGFNGGLDVFADSVQKSRKLIETAMGRIRGHSVRLNIRSLPGSTNNHQAMKDKVLVNPVVKNAMEVFNGKIVEIKTLKGRDTSDHGREK